MPPTPKRKERRFYGSRLVCLTLKTAQDARGARHFFVGGFRASVEDRIVQLERHMCVKSSTGRSLFLFVRCSRFRLVQLEPQIRLKTRLSAVFAVPSTTALYN